ncbi:MAG: TIGR02996 domain-containing protein [Planctomycetes bacterium]|nr:TIGR02996 domain-containing protein [Planctomycetota bacterium]
MSDEDALLAAILAHSDEDTPRLIYADWLEEHGQPERAEFIRIQCDTTADEAAEERAAELEERNRTKWLTGLPTFSGARWVFRRGFPERLDVPEELFLERYDAFARVPWVRSLTVHELHNRAVRDIANRPWNTHWIELELQAHPSGLLFEDDNDHTPTFIAIANCPQVAQLRRLHLSMFDPTPQAIDALAASPHLARLKELRLSFVYEGDFGPLRDRFGDRLTIDW